MGARKAQQAMSTWGGQVPPNALLALVYMALTSPDSSPESLYWKGWDAIAVDVFGRSEPVSKADRQSVKRAVMPLFEHGAVKLDRPSAPGRQARYALNLDDYTVRNPYPEQGTESDPCQRGTESVPRSGQQGTDSGPTGYGIRTPEEEEEKLKQDDSTNTHTRGEAAARPGQANDQPVIAGTEDDPVPDLKIAPRPKLVGKGFDIDREIARLRRRIDDSSGAITYKLAREVGLDPLDSSWWDRVSDEDSLLDLPLWGAIDEMLRALKVGDAGGNLKENVGPTLRMELKAKVDAVHDWLDGEADNDELPEAFRDEVRAILRILKEAKASAT